MGLSVGGLIQGGGRGGLFEDRMDIFTRKSEENVRYFSVYS